MLRIGSVVLGVEDLTRAIEFWQEALGYVLREDPEDDTWAVLLPRGGKGAQVSLMKSETPVQSTPRIHLDLYATDRDDEVARLLELGAKEVEWPSYPDDADFVVLADTEGNIFCVIEKSRDWIGFR